MKALGFAWHAALPMIIGAEAASVGPATASSYGAENKGKTCRRRVQPDSQLATASEPLRNAKAANDFHIRQDI
jgi:hypothetical protein